MANETLDLSIALLNGLVGSGEPESADMKRAAQIAYAVDGSATNDPGSLLIHAIVQELAKSAVLDPDRRRGVLAALVSGANEAVMWGVELPTWRRIEGICAELASERLAADAELGRTTMFLCALAEFEKESSGVRPDHDALSRIFETDLKPGEVPCFPGSARAAPNVSPSRVAEAEFATLARAVAAEQDFSRSAAAADRAWYCLARRNPQER